MNHGKCIGVPFDGRSTAHPEPTMRVAIDKQTGKIDAAVIAGSNYDFGTYRWDGKLWQWTPPAAPSSPA